MAQQQLARGIWSGFAPTERPFGTPNGMDDNLRLIDDHLALYTLAAPAPLGTALPSGAKPGDGQIFANGSYAVFNGGTWKTYPPRLGLRAVELTTRTHYVNIGTAWQALTDKTGRAYLTLAALQVDKTLPAGSQGFVTADPAHTDTNPINGWYTWTGAAWVRNAWQPANQSDLDNALSGLSTLISKQTINAALAVADPDGFAPLTIGYDGYVNAPLLRAHLIDIEGSRVESVSHGAFSLAVADENGYVAFGVRADGSVYPDIKTDATAGWSELRLGDDDSIVHIGDSYTAAHYVLKDKAFVSQLSQLSPYRHINFGVSGNDALDMQYRIVNGVATFDTTLTSMRARYAIITTLTNDAQFSNASQSYYRENVRRLIETVRATGAEPVLTTQFSATAVQHTLLTRLADECGCAFIDATSYNVEVGRLKLGPFFQGHPGTRTGCVFWLPMLDFIDRLPQPDRAIKIYRRRPTFAASSIADLLYTTRIERALRWKELTLGHYSISPEYKFEELNKLGTVGTDFNYVKQTDEYWRLISGQAVTVGDYALLEITLPGDPGTLDAVELTINANAAATVYVRDLLDVGASLPGKAQGITPADPVYLSRWDKPRGAWRSLGLYAAPIVIPAPDLMRSMTGRTLIVLLAGSFDLSALRVRYKGRERKPVHAACRRADVLGPELLTQTLCGNSVQLADWSVTGSPTTLVPIDVTNAPRKPGQDLPVDGVVTITSADSIGQSVALPAETGLPRRFKLYVWCRYYPRAFLDPALYPGIDPAQIVDRKAYPSGAEISSDTCDLRTLRCEVWCGTSRPSNGGAEFFDFAALQWRCVEFEIDALAFGMSSISFSLSCTDGVIQVAKVSIRECL